MKAIVKQEKILSEIIDDLKVPAIAQIKALELFLSTTASKINPDEKDLIELTLNSCNNMQNMIDNFSFISKLKNEKISISYKHFDFIGMLKKSLKEADILLKYSNLKLKLNLEHLKDVYADEDKIKKAIDNMLSFAINASFKNSKLIISGLKIKEGIKFEIVFKSFRKNDDIIEIFNQNQQYSSKYLQLFIAKEIIKAHFGKIIFKNYEDDMTVLGFLLPGC